MLLVTSERIIRERKPMTRASKLMILRVQEYNPRYVSLTSSPIEINAALITFTCVHMFLGNWSFELFALLFSSVDIRGIFDCASIIT